MNASEGGGADVAAMIAENRRRYENLKAAAGQVTPRALPTLSDRALGAAPPQGMLRKETIPGGWYWTARLTRGEALRLLNVAGNPGVSVFAWNAKDPSERYNSADTIKVQWTSEMRKGRVLLSDMGRALFSIIEDSCGAHDTVVGGSTPASNKRKYGDFGLRSTRENLVLAAGKLGLGVRDLAPVITFFAPVAVVDGGLVWRDGVVQKGDFVDLRAELDLLVVVSNCPHPLAPDAVFGPAPVEALIYAANDAGADDPCRNASPEALRAFENNAAYLQG
ncbi:urea amidolyase associated protein UAAP1 [Methylocystis parvus]|uniref:urea amidolyase associated protein UAAP1 n=1 Tax=Methylocystis parvus TaxID=134 RepID=UPI003C782432